MAIEENDPETDEARRRRMRALQAVARTAADRFGDRPGFDCLLLFLTWERLRDLDPKHEDSVFLDTSERKERFTERYGSVSSRVELVRMLLGMAVKSEDELSIALARRIVARMDIPHCLGPVKPLIYTVGIDDGVAVALAVYDEFWTEGW